MNSHQRRKRRRGPVRSSDLLSDSRRIGIDIEGGGTMSFRCHGEPTPEFLLAMKAMGEAAAEYVRRGGCSDNDQAERMTAPLPTSELASRFAGQSFAPASGSGFRVYHEEAGIRIFHGDSREIVPTLGGFDLLLTDPPYGIKQDTGMGGGGYDGFGGGKKRTPKAYAGGWDDTTPDLELMRVCLEACRTHIVWGGNYLSAMLPQKPKWLVWDKEQTMPTYSDAELAWTTLPGVAVKMLRYNGSGLMAKEKSRQHPTQKPLNLMLWCLQLAGDAQTILDPFAGSGTTGRACKDLGKQCVLIEREERYCEIAAKRLAQDVLPLGIPNDQAHL